MVSLIVLPPIVFIILLVFGWALSRLFKNLSFKSAGKQAEGTKECYACGEEKFNHFARPDYSVFFSFAFFFTLAHVATLVVTCVPKETASSFVMAVIYIFGAVLGLSILLRK
jgi:NADH:ubiquinone oxidoreductase subunit 3 (subunit A)